MKHHNGYYYNIQVVIRERKHPKSAMLKAALKRKFFMRENLFFFREIQFLKAFNFHSFFHHQFQFLLCALEFITYLKTSLLRFQMLKLNKRYKLHIIFKSFLSSRTVHNLFYLTYGGCFDR